MKQGLLDFVVSACCNWWPLHYAYISTDLNDLVSSCQLFEHVFILKAKVTFILAARYSSLAQCFSIVMHSCTTLSQVTFSSGVQSISFPLTLFAIQAVIVTCSRLLKPSKASQCWVHDSISPLSSEHWAARETALQELIQPPEVLFQPN